MEEHYKIILRDFLANNWSEFESYCETLDVSANDIYVELGGESEE